MNQTQQILTHLQKHGSITPLEALRRYGCFRLGARIWELRNSLYWRCKRGTVRVGDIRTEMIKFRGKHFARYSLA